MIDCASTVLPVIEATRLVGDLLAILDDDPGHGIDRNFNPMGQHRNHVVRDYRTIVQAIRRGE